MARSRTRSIGWVLVVVTGALALRPVELLERALDLMLLPGRVLVSLATPIGALQARDGAGADERRALRDAADLEAHRRLEASVRRAAWPTAVVLADGVGAVQAEVVGHVFGELDVLRLAVSEPERVRTGQPVIAGDAYVGTVVRTPGREAPPAAPSGWLAGLAESLGLGARRVVHAPDEVLVELVTAREARVGARIDISDDGGPCRLVVGGLAPRIGAPMLAVHNPERRAVASGLVRVFEPEALSDELVSLAHGFVIGELRREQQPVPGSDFTRAILGVHPYLDYEAGLHQVLVLADDGVRAALPEEHRTVLRDGGFLPARFFLRAEPASWREGRKLDRGRRHGVVTGAAVTSGARLVGRVARAGLVTSDVALVGDPGFSLSVLAQPLVLPSSTVEREARELEAAEADPRPPFVLGRLVGLGRAEDGAVRFRWAPLSALGADLGGDLGRGGGKQLDGSTGAVGSAGLDKATVGWLTVRLWTGSGEVGVPRGLLIGTAELPLGPGVHELRVTQAEGTRDPSSLKVRLAEGRSGR